MSFSLSRSTDYALVALARLAMEWVDGGRPVSARRIADEYSLPLPLLMNLLKDLHAAGLVDSRRGSGGGYYLTRGPNEISLAEIVAAIDGPMQMTMCCGEDNHGERESDGEPCQQCRQMPSCPITKSMRRVNELVAVMLEQVSLEQLLANDLDGSVFESAAAAVAGEMVQVGIDRRPARQLV
jgi:Rrf2 family protein